MSEKKEELKTCFVIMPISDSEPYLPGHFKRVYEHLIKPACKAAGFEPIRADDVQTTNYIALDIVKQILNCDMAICDLSSRNPNVLYELGIRQAFNKPVTLIKDLRTSRIFDIAGFRDVPYDESLRIDTVEVGIESLSATIKNTYANHDKEINSLIKLLGIEAAQIVDHIKVSPDTEVLINMIGNLSKDFSDLATKFPQLKASSQTMKVFDVDKLLTTELRAEEKNIHMGDVLKHPKFGVVEIKNIGGTDFNPIATIRLQNGEEKKIMINYANLQNV